MKANELMVGDWVQVPSLIDNIEHFDAWCQVKQLRDNDLDVVGFKELRYDEIIPIPLSVEILEKNGLEKDNHGRLYGEYFDEDKNRDLEISVDDKTGEIWWSYNWDEYWIIRLRYVHELQNALRLCGIEKEIML